MTNFCFRPSLETLNARDVPSTTTLDQPASTAEHLTEAEYQAALQLVSVVTADGYGAGPNYDDLTPIAYVDPNQQPGLPPLIVPDPTTRRERPGPPRRPRPPRRTACTTRRRWPRPKSAR